MLTGDDCLSNLGPIELRHAIVNTIFHVGLAGDEINACYVRTRAQRGYWISLAKNILTDIQLPTMLKFLIVPQRRVSDSSIGRQ